MLTDMSLEKSYIYQLVTHREYQLYKYVASYSALVIMMGFVPFYNTKVSSIISISAGQYILILLAFVIFSMDTRQI